MRNFRYNEKAEHANSDRRCFRLWRCSPTLSWVFSNGGVMRGECRTRLTSVTLKGYIGGAPALRTVSTRTWVGYKYNMIARLGHQGHRGNKIPETFRHIVENTNAGGARQMACHGDLVHEIRYVGRLTRRLGRSDDGDGVLLGTRM